MRLVDNLEKTHFYTSTLGSIYTVAVMNSGRLQAIRGGLMAEPIPYILWTNTILSISLAFARAFCKPSPPLSPKKRLFSHALTWSTNIYVATQIYLFLRIIENMRLQIVVMN
ncbi:MAG: hypothetical protein FJZ60_02610 [Chlamydiae bacterium]|nr:hypothetical protein [Chlamydiota bacterium]